MKTEKLKVYLCCDSDPEYRTVFSFDPSESDFPGNKYVVLASAEVEFAISKTDSEITLAAIESLRAQKQEVLAEAEVKANKIEARIQSMLAITYEPA